MKSRLNYSLCGALQLIYVYTLCQVLNIIRILIQLNYTDLN